MYVIPIFFSFILLSSTPVGAFNFLQTSDEPLIFDTIPEASAQLSNFTLSGYVYDKFLIEPISGATVSIPDLGLVTTTELFGFYRFDNITTGTYNVTVLTNGYFLNNADVEITERWVRQDFEMTGTGTGGEAKIPTGVLGFVRDRNTGLPIINAQVTIDPPSPITNPTPDISFPLVLMTDDIGFYDSGPLPETSYDITFSNTGYNEVSNSFTAITGTPDAHSTAVRDAYLKAEPFSITGTVTGFLGGAASEGIPDVRVQAKLIVDATAGIEEIYKITKTTSGAETGDSSVNLVSNVTISVSADPNGHEPFIALPTSQVLTVVQTTGSSTITVTSNDSKWIAVTGTIDANNNIVATGTGTAAGFSNVPASFTGVYNPESQVITSATYILGGSSSLPGDFDDGKIRYSIAFSAPDNPPDPEATPNGTFTFDDLPPGTFEIIVTPTAYEPLSTTVQLELEGNHDITNIDFDYPNKAQFNVTVTSDAYGGIALPDISVELRSLDSSLSVGKEIKRVETTDSLGIAVFDNLPAGTFEIFTTETPTTNSALGNYRFTPVTITKTVFALEPTNVIDLEINLEPILWSMSGKIQEKTDSQLALDTIKEFIRTTSGVFFETKMLSLNPEIPKLFDGLTYLEGGTIAGTLTSETCIPEGEFGNCSFGGPSGKTFYSLQDLQSATVRIAELEILGQSVDTSVLDDLTDITDTNGNYVLQNIPPGFVTFEVTKPDFLPKKFFFSFPPLESDDLLSDPNFCAFSNSPLCNGDAENLFKFDTTLRPQTERIFGDIYGVLVTDEIKAEKRVKLGGATITVTSGGTTQTGNTDEYGVFEINDIPLNFNSALYDSGEVDIRQLTETPITITITSPSHETIQINRTISSLEDYDFIDGTSFSGVSTQPHAVYAFQELLSLQNAAQIHIDAGNVLREVDEFNDDDGNTIFSLGASTSQPNINDRIGRSVIAVIDGMTGFSTNRMSQIGDISTLGFGNVTDTETLRWNDTPEFEDPPTDTDRPPLDLFVLAGGPYEVVIPFPGPFATNLCRVNYSNLAAGSENDINITFTTYDDTLTIVTINAPGSTNAVCGKDALFEFDGKVKVFDSITNLPIEGVTVKPFFTLDNTANFARIDRPADNGTTDSNGFASITSILEQLLEDPDRWDGFLPDIQNFPDAFDQPIDFSADYSRSGYEDSLGAFLGDVCGFGGNGCGGSEARPIKILMTPRPEIVANIISSTQTDDAPKFNESGSPGGALLDGAELFLDKGVKGPITTNYQRTITLLDSSADTFPVGQISTGPLTQFTDYTISASAFGHYPLEQENNITIVVQVLDSQRTVVFELEPIPEPEPVVGTFHVFYPQGTEGGSGSDNSHERELLGFIVKGIQNPITENGQWEIQIDREAIKELRAGFEDPILSVNLKVAPNNSGICERDQNLIDKNKLELESLSRIFPGVLQDNTVSLTDSLGDSITGTSDPAKRSIWKGTLDPANDLPCGELDWTVQMVTKELGTLEVPTSSSPPKIYPSYLFNGFPDFIIKFGLFVDENVPSFITSNAGFTIKNDIFGEMALGKTTISLTGDKKEHLNYAVNSTSIKTDFGVKKFFSSPILGWSAIPDLQFPTIFAGVNPLVLNGTRGQFSSNATLALDPAISVTKADQTDPSLPSEFGVEELVEFSQAAKFGTIKEKYAAAFAPTSLTLKDRVNLDGTLKISYNLEHLNAQGVENPKFGNDMSTVTEVLPSRITETISPEVGVTIKLPRIELGSKFAAPLPPLATGLTVLENLFGLSLIGVTPTATLTVRPSYSSELEKFDLDGPVIRTIKEDTQPTIGFGADIEPTLTLGLFNDHLAATGKVKGSLDLTYSLKDDTTESDLEPTTEFSAKAQGNLSADLIGKVPFLGEYKKEYKTNNYVFFERTWNSTSTVNESQMILGPTIHSYEVSVLNTNKNTGDLITNPPSTSDAVQSGDILSEVYASKTLSLDTNNDGQAIIGFLGHDPTKDAPTSIQVEHMFYQDGSFTFEGPTSIKTENIMPDVSGPSIKYLPDGRNIGVWNTIDDDVTKPYELLLDLNKSELEFAIFEPNTQTWSDSQMITSDNFIDVTPQIAVDDSTGDVIAVWIKDMDGYPMTTDDQSLYHSIWDGVSWSSPDVIVDGVDVLGFDVVFRDGTAALVFTDISENQRIANLVTFENNTWSAPQLISDGFVSSVPGVRISNDGIGTVLWTQLESGDFFPTLFSSSFINSLGPKQEVSKVGVIGDLKVTDLNDNTVVVWSQSTFNGTSLNYGEFDGTGWNLFSALSILPSFDIPLLATQTDESTDRLLISYYRQQNVTSDLGFYRTTLTGGEAEIFDGPVEPGESDEDATDTTSPAVISAAITGPNTITITYSEPVTSSIGDYTNLNLLAGGTRAIIAISGSGTNAIELTFDGTEAGQNETGTINIAATVADLAGNLITEVIGQVLADGQVITIPVITDPTDGDTITTDTVTLTGTSGANVTIEIFDDATSLGTATADANGDWTFTTLTLPDGAHSFTTTADDGVDTSAASAAVIVTIDTSASPSSFTAWTQAVLDLRLTKSQAFQDTFPIDTNEEINRLLAWAGNPVAQNNNPELQQFGHLYSIMKRWNERADLQNVFPGSNLAADPVNLVIWSGRANVLANEFNSDLVPHEPTYVLLRYFFLERDDLRNNSVFSGSLDGSDPSRLYCFAANSGDSRLTPHTAFYTTNCVL